LVVQTNKKAPRPEAANQTGVSVAAIALANGMNANLRQRWITVLGREMMMAHALPSSRRRHVHTPNEHDVTFLDRLLTADTHDSHQFSVIEAPQELAVRRADKVRHDLLFREGVSFLLTRSEGGRTLPESE